VNVLRHEHITDQPKPMPSPHLVENLYESVACSARSEQRTASVTAKRDEVQIPSTVKSLKRIPHTV
jgi:hypothetical protein